MKTLKHKSKVFTIALVIANLFFVNTAFGQATKTWVPTTGGPWTTAANWSPSGAPSAGDNVIIGSNQSATITAVPVISLALLTINGNCTFEPSTSGNLITVTGTFTVANNVTFTLGTTTAGYFNFTLSSSGVGYINGNGVFSLGSNTTARTITISGNLSIAPNAYITGFGGASDFTLSNGATLQIGSTGGITTSGATGNVQVPSTRTYSTTANYIYNGTNGAQAAGNGLPSTVSNLTISNTSGVTLPSAKIVSNNLSITAGAFINLGTFSHTAGTLTLGGTGTVSGTWGSSSSSAANKNNIFFAATSGTVNVTTSTCTPPAAPTVSSPVNYCQNVTAILLTATGPGSLLWYTVPVNGTGSSTAPTPSTTSIGTTSYYVSQTVGCEGPRATIVVNVNPLPSASVTAHSDVTCFSENDGSITIQATGGTAPYDYSVDGGTTTWISSVLNPYAYGGLIANTPYRIKVKDHNGCLSK